MMLRSGNITKDKPPRSSTAPPPPAFPRVAHSQRSVQSTQSSATRRANLEAQQARKDLQRQKELAEKEKAVEELELQAQILQMQKETRDRRSCRSNYSDPCQIQDWISKSQSIHETPVPQHDKNLPRFSDGVRQLPFEKNKQEDTLLIDINTENYTKQDIVSDLPHCNVRETFNPTSGNSAYIRSAPGLPHYSAGVVFQPTSGENIRQKNYPYEFPHSRVERPHCSHQNCGSNNLKKLPNFDGNNTTEWLIFKHQYNNTKNMFSEQENLSRIGDSLQGAAKNAVGLLLAVAEKAETVVELLERRFARPDLIVLKEIANAKALPRINFEGKELNAFACTVRNVVETVKLLNHKGYLMSPELMNILLSKLNPILRSHWVEFAARSFEFSTLSPEISTLSPLENLASFLDHEASLQVRFGYINENTEVNKRFENNRAYSNREKVNVAAVTTKGFCLYCHEDNHSNIENCKSFKSLNILERYQWTIQNKVCIKCLVRGSHKYNTCKPKCLCNVKGCQFEHHRLLHSYSTPSTTTATTEIKEVEVAELVENVSTNTAMDVTSNTEQPFLKIIPVLVSGLYKTISTYALLDDGSTATLIDSTIKDLIGVQGREGHIQINGVGGLCKQTKVNYVDFDIKGQYTHEKFSIKGARSIDNLGMAIQSIIVQDIKAYSYLNDIKHQLCYKDAKPMIIIGIDNWHLTIPKVSRRGTSSQTVASLTALGWVLYGFSYSKTRPIELMNHCNISSPITDDKALENIIKEYYKLDSIGITKTEPLSNDNERAVSILKKTVRRLPSGDQFEAGLLWREDDRQVPNNRDLALSRFKGLELKMKKNPQYATIYKQNIHAMLDKGYAEECNIIEKPTSTEWYLPHFGVLNPHKPGKVRVVHDAAAACQGISLNSMLLAGPDNLCSLLHILFRFREKRVAMTADIREMFPQVKIIETDRDAQRFFWRNIPSEPLKIYRMSSMIFGATSSPCTAHYVKNSNALEFNSRFPDAVKIILQDHYMDDCICSVDTPEFASKLAKDIVDIHRAAHFEMRGWVSNQDNIFMNLSSELLLNFDSKNNVVNKNSSSLSVRILGLVWRPLDDVLTFDLVEFGKPSKGFTKRFILSSIMKLFDPVGFLTPISITGRIMFQQTWSKGLGWDDELLKDDIILWKKWFDDVVESIQIKLPRWHLCMSESPLVEELISLELHMFCDASESAYSTVAYWRFVYANDRVKLSLVASKARVAPLKPCSIPRLELQAALLAVRLATTICEGHRLIPSKRYFWTDSMTVLGWIRSDSRVFKPFVAHRVGEIIENTSVLEWGWLPSALNIADDATRLFKSAITIDSRWITGPGFLLLKSKFWPKEPSQTSSVRGNDEYKTNVNETKCEVINTLFNRILSVDSDRFSSWLRLLRTTARVHQYVRNLKIKVLVKRGHDIKTLVKTPGTICSFLISDNETVPELSGVELCADDLFVAERSLLRLSQFLSFPQELQLLEAGQALPRKSKLLHLSPELDHHGIIRLIGRIRNCSDITTEYKEPVILDSRNKITQLLIHHYHKKTAHANENTVISSLRQRYWILSLRNAVRKCSRTCQFCIVRKSLPSIPPFGDLPMERLAHHKRPFTYVGLDYFGPILVTVNRSHVKRYVALFTCMTSRAIHLEIVSSLTSASALMAIKRFIARRGLPLELLSDHGTAFTGADRELQGAYRSELHDFATNNGFKWKFIPPLSPSFGGAWERLIKSVKIALSATLLHRNPKEEVLHTLLIEAEAVVNSRPLTYPPHHPSDPEPLTPFHFLIGTANTFDVPLHLTDRDLLSKSDWRKSMRLADHFWERWVKEYLPNLQPRKNTDGSFKNLEIGDVVIIADSSMPRGVWPKGVVRSLHSAPGDSVTRVVTLETSVGLLKRPVRKLIPISHLNMF